MDISELSESNPSLWRCLKAQGVMGCWGEGGSLYRWQGPTYSHKTPCRVPLSYKPDAPNLIIWTGGAHFAVLSFRSDVLPGVDGETEAG